MIRLVEPPHRPVLGDKAPQYVLGLGLTTLLVLSVFVYLAFVFVHTERRSSPPRRMPQQHGSPTLANYPNR